MRAVSLVFVVSIWGAVVGCEPDAADAEGDAGVLLVDGDACDVDEVITDAANPIFHRLSLSAGPLAPTEVVLRVVDASRPGVQVVPPSDNGDGTVRFGVLVSRGTPATATLRFEHGNPDVPVCDRALSYVVD